MTAFTIRVSQRVYFDVEIEAASAVEALREAARCIDPGEMTPGPDLDDYPMAEADSDGYVIEPMQHAEYEADPQFVLELRRLVK